MDEISLREFQSEVQNSGRYSVDLRESMQICGVSPVHIQYKPDKIIVLPIFPERIVLKSGNSMVHITQIYKIVREKRGNKSNYTVFCGDLDDLKTTVKIFQE